VQTLNHGSNTSNVSVNPSGAYKFVKWNDESTANPRNDINVTASNTFTASCTLSNICNDDIKTTYDNLGYCKVLAKDGKYWLDRNLGATKVATSKNDTSSYGYLFQWGRKANA
jgi:hypothetical protein